MRGRIALCGIFLLTTLFFASSRPAEAAEVWTAKYWNNRWMSGEPDLIRNESGIDKNWGGGSPEEDIISSNEFSAEFVTQTYFDEGTYRFSITADDGVRLFIDGVEVYNAWYDTQKHITDTDVYLKKGDHDLKVQYYEGGGQAVLRMTWKKVTNYQQPAGIWNAEYFDNVNLSGTPVVTQNENQINYNWPFNPTTNVPIDRFSVRWSADMPVETGTYRFNITVDDGARLFINNQKVWDQWFAQPEASFSVDVNLSAGTVPIKLEYFDIGGPGVIRMNWSKLDSSEEARIQQNATSTTFTDWKGEYFDNTELLGSPKVTRNDPAINWNWGTSSPVPNVLPNDFYSVRWTKTENLAAGTYKFRAYADDGVRVYVGDELVIDHWDLATGNWHEGFATVPGGDVQIRVEYLERNLMSEIWAGWEPANAAEAVLAGGETVDLSQSDGFASLQNARALTVRSGPDRTFGAIDFITGDMVVRLLGRDSITYWIKVELPDGTIGWSSGRFLSSVTDFETLPILE
ncbi:MAG: PA14 domain-containing protein [Chloroflexota bacterium]